MSKKPEYYHPIDDRQLMHRPGPTADPVYLVRSLGCYASVLLLVLSWVGTVAVIAWQGWRLTWVPFVVIPAVAWVGLLALPMFIKFRAGALTTLDAMVKTSEAYLARAGWSVDINSDGRIGHHVPVVQPPVEEYRPLIVNGRVRDEVHKSLPAPVYPDAAKDHVGGGDRLDPAPDRGGDPDQVKVKIWHLPNRERIEQGELEQFIDGAFVKGLARGQWVGPGRLMTRPQYDGCMALLQEAKLIDGRQSGHPGRLTVRTAQQARRVLDLPVS